MIFRLVFLFSVLQFATSFEVLAQSDSLNFAETPEDTLKKPKHPSKKAALYSAILPGAGQVYNHIKMNPNSRRKWNVYWKVPLIYGAIGFSGYQLFSQQREIGRLQEEVRFRLANDGATNNVDYAFLDTQALIQLNNNAQTLRDLFILTTAVAYAINILDAAVEAHFINFDVSDDLSLRVRPKAMPNFGLGISLSLHRNTSI